MTKSLLIVLSLLSLPALADPAFSDNVHLGATIPSAYVFVCSEKPTKLDFENCTEQLNTAVSNLERRGFTILKTEVCSVRSDWKCQISEGKFGTGVTGSFSFWK